MKKEWCLSTRHLAMTVTTESVGVAYPDFDLDRSLQFDLDRNVRGKTITVEKYGRCPRCNRRFKYQGIHCGDDYKIDLYIPPHKDKKKAKLPRKQKGKARGRGR